MSEIKLVSLETCVNACIYNEEFMREWRRLSGHTFGIYDSGINNAIDKATGYDTEQAKELFDFIRDYIWIPVNIQILSGKEL